MRMPKLNKRPKNADGERFGDRELDRGVMRVCSAGRGVDSGRCCSCGAVSWQPGEWCARALSAALGIEPIATSNSTSAIQANHSRALLCSGRLLAAGHPCVPS